MPDPTLEEVTIGIVGYYTIDRTTVTVTKIVGDEVSVIIGPPDSTAEPQVTIAGPLEVVHSIVIEADRQLTLARRGYGQ